MATIIDVAKLANVSKSTVSRVLTDTGSVSDLARKRVLIAIKQLDYRNNKFARGYRRNCSNTIGVVLVDMTSAYFCSLLEGIQEVFAEQGMSVLVASGYGVKEKEIHAIKSLMQRRCDGLITYLENSVDATDLSMTERFTTPLITIGPSSAFQAQASVEIDNHSGGYLAAKSLLEAGHKKIVHLAGLACYQDACKRLIGFEQAMKEYGIDDYYVVRGKYEDQFGYSATQLLLKNGIEFSAICAGDDDIAAGVYLALREANLSIPDQISVIGYDDNFHAKHLYPPLSTIKQPSREMGEIAAKLLLDQLDNKQAIDKCLKITPSFVSRSSILTLK